MTAARDYPRIVTPPPGPKARVIVEKQNTWASTSYPKEYPLAIARGERAVVEDVDGNRFLDFMAGIAVASTGYGHPKVVKAVQEAAGKFLHICGSDFYYESFANLCERLAKLAPGSSKKRVFLSNSGTEAVEGAIKLARHSTGRPAIIGFLGAFHGRSYGGLSLTASKAVQRSGFAPFLPEIHHVPYGYRYRCEYCRGEDACTMRCVSWIEQELFTKKVPPDSVAAIFVEPIQGEGGYVVPPAGYLQALRELCDRHGILLVADEVQSGIGRSGKMFACEVAGIDPDLMCLSKGITGGFLPLGATLCSDAIHQEFAGPGRSFFHGHSYTGNPLACAAAVANLEVFDTEDVFGRIHGIAEQHAHRLPQIASHPLVDEVRQIGTIAAIELKAEDTGYFSSLKPRLYKFFLDHDVLLRPLGNVIYVLPPYSITRDQLDHVYDVITEALETIH